MVERRHSLASVLDDMAAQNKARLDALLRRSTGTAEALAPQNTKVSRLDPAPSEPVRHLNQRFGDGWHYEIAAQHCEGGEAIVLVKLTIAKTGAVKSQFGRARLDGGPVEGKSGGVSFRLAGNPGNEMEADAYRRATEEALMRCAELV
jgi:hypothetical protein